MKRHQRKTLAAIRDVLPDGVTLTFETGGKHCRVVITQGDRRVRLPISTTPKTSASHLPAVAQVRKLFGADGRLKPHRVT
jgi:hypothetical protein